MDRSSYLYNELKKYFDSVSDIQVQLFLQYYDMVVEKNQYMNLTAITDFEEFVHKHIIDSLQIYRVVDLSESDYSLIDIGTGAGFPGIPLKIMYPNLHIILFDSLKKRLDFLDEVIRTLKLTDISTLHGRAEEFGRKPEYREKFDLVVSRAVAELTSLAEISIPFCKLGGFFISYKGNKGQQELSDAKYCINKLNSVVSDTVSFKLISDDASTDSFDRVLIKIKKLSLTDNKYPRGGGKPFKQPLYLV